MVFRFSYSPSLNIIVDKNNIKYQTIEKKVIKTKEVKPLTEENKKFLISVGYKLVE